MIMSYPTPLAAIAEHLGAALRWVRSRLSDGPTVDITQLNDQLWTGGTIESEADVEYIISRGITVDVDMQEEHSDESLLASHPDVDFLWIRQTDDGAHKPTSDYRAIWTFVKPRLDARRIVVAHCAAGHNRGPSAAYFILRAYWGLSAADALTLIKSRRPSATVAYAADADRAVWELFGR